MNIISHIVTLEPAYGRDYKKGTEVEKDFRAGRDFIGDYSLGFKYVNIEAFSKGATVKLRYSNNRRVYIISV